MALVIAIGALCSFPARSAEEGYAALASRPLPTSDAQRRAECDWIVSQEARQRSFNELIPVMADDPQDAAFMQLIFKRNMGFLSSRYSRIQCQATAVAPTEPVPPQIFALVQQFYCVDQSTATKARLCPEDKNNSLPILLGLEVKENERIARGLIEGYYASRSGCAAAANKSQQDALALEVHFSKTWPNDDYLKSAKVRCDPVKVNP
jgi:hypothetical protein